MKEVELKEQLESARRQIQRVAQEFALEYRPESYRFLFVSRRESCLRNYLAAPMYAEFGATKAERARNLEKFLSSPIYAQLTGPRSMEGCTITRKELEDEMAVIAQITNPALRAEYEALYDKLAHHMQGQLLTLFSFSQPETRWDPQEFQEKLAYLVLHEWLHILLKDNGIYFQDRDKSWEWDEGLVTYLMAFLGEEDLDRQIDEDSPIAKEHRQYREAGRRWQDLLKGCKTPKERKEAILKVLRE